MAAKAISTTVVAAGPPFTLDALHTYCHNRNVQDANALWAFMAHSNPTKTQALLTEADSFVVLKAAQRAARAWRRIRWPK